MSMEIYVACPSSALPEADQLQLAVRQNGIDLVIPVMDWSTQSGFLPMVLKGRESGVEVDVYTGADALDAVSAFGIFSVGAVVAMRWGGDIAECACAYTLAGAISVLTNGRTFDPEQGVELTPAKAFDQAKSAISIEWLE